FLVGCESSLKVMSLDLCREHDARLGAERHGKLRDEQVGLGRREVHREGLAAVLDYGAAGRAPGRSRTLVLPEDVEGDLLASADKLDGMALHDDDIAAIVALRRTLRRGAKRHRGNECCNGYARQHGGVLLLLPGQ